LNKELDIIIQKLRSGDEKFYRSVFYEYYPLLTYYANKYVNNLEVAKEIVQEFFVRLYEKRFSLNIDSSFKSYLYKSIYNSCINHLNQIAVREQHHRKIKSTTYEKTVLSESDMNMIELEKKIYDEIEKLPAQCKRIFKMNRFDGLTNSEIAEKLKLSKRTVETQISKALRILRKNVPGEYFE
jgi:RNA polymerase sigma-70 factor (ECF subfamily)